MTDRKAATMGLSAQELQKYDTEAKKVLLHEWLLAPVLSWLFEEYAGLTPEEVAALMRSRDSGETTHLNADGSIHPGAVLEALQQEFAEERKGKSILDIFIKTRLPASSKRLQVYVDIQNSQLSEDRDSIRGFLYVVRIVSRQLEGKLSTMDTSPYEKVYGIWIFPDAARSKQGKISRRFIAEQEVRKADRSKNENRSIQDTNIAEWFHIYLGTPTEQDLANITLISKADKLIDLLQVVMTDKIKTERKPDLLHKRHQVNITTEMKGDLESMTNYEAMAKTYNDNLRQIHVLQTLLAERDSALAEKDQVLAEKDQALAQRDTEIEALRSELARIKQSANRKS